MKVAVCVSGVGTLLLSSMSRFPGSSGFFLEGSNQYCRESITKYLVGQQPGKFCSKETAILTAHRAFLNAQSLLFDSVGKDYKRLPQVNMKNALGISVNGSLSSNYEKKGRIQCFMALKQFDRVDSYHLLLNEPRGRLAEEQLFSNECMELISQFIKAKKEQLSAKQRLNCYKITDPSLKLEAWSEDIEPHNFKSMALPSMFAEPPLEQCAIFSGSFNPFHRGHLEMYRLSEKHELLQGKPILLELTLKNADKAADIDILPRLRSIVDLFDGKQPTFEPSNQSFEQIMQELSKRNIQVLLSHSGRFIDKGLKNGVFILGADTFLRLTDQKFYGNDLKEMRKAICKFTVDDVSFLVFHRKAEGHELPITPTQDLHFEVVDNWSNPVSSTEIRQHHHHE